jgi:hypothetical protein
MRLVPVVVGKLKRQAPQRTHRQEGKGLRFEGIAHPAHLRNGLYIAAKPIT